MIRTSERTRESTLDLSAEGGSAVEGGALQSERTSRAEGDHRRRGAGEQISQTEAVLRVMEGAQVLVGGGRGRAASDDAEDDRGEHESGGGTDGADPQGRLHERVEGHLDEVLEAPHEQPGGDPGDRRDEDDLPRSTDQTPELVPSHREGVRPQTSQQTAPPHASGVYAPDTPGMRRSDLAGCERAGAQPTRPIPL